MSKVIRVHKWLLRILFLLGSVAVGLYLVNLLLLITAPFGIDHFAHRRGYEETFIGPSRDPLVLFELRPDRTLEAGVLYRTNSLGARGPEVPIPKPDGVFRILFAGDSNTFGWGVAEEKTFPFRTAELIAERAEKNTVDVINLSALGYNTVQEVALVRSKGLAAEPDLVLIVFCVNDLFVEGKDLDYVNQEKALFDAKQSGFDRFFIDRVKPFTKRVGLWHVHDFLNYLFIARHHDTYYDRVENFYRGIDEGFSVVKTALDEFRRLGKAKGFTPVLLDLAGLDRLEAHCAETGLFYVSLYDSEVQKGREYWNSPCDPHPNAKAHDFYARRIVEGLEPLLREAALIR